MAKVLTDVAIRNLRPETERREVPDPGARGLYVIVQPSGRRGYAVRYRFGGKPRKLTLAAGLSLAAARKAAADALHEVSQGRDPGEAKQVAKEKSAAAAANTLQAVCDEYLRREGKKLRTINARRAVLDRLVFPVIGRRPIGDIKRGEIVRLLDQIEEQNGPRQADLCLAYLSRVFNWFALRDDDFKTPLARGMARHGSKEHARARILADDELRRVWLAAGAAGPFPAMVRFLLLTACRKSEASGLTRDEIGDGVWTLPASRNKVKVDLVRPLSKAAQDLLAGVPRIDGCPYVFASGVRPLGGFSRRKSKFDLQCGVTSWCLHDLRRTARSLMSRAGVNSDHAERCLGHVIGGVRGTYDRHEYRQEMLSAYEALGALIERIVHPQENVVALRR